MTIAMKSLSYKIFLILVLLFVRGEMLGAAELKDSDIVTDSAPSGTHYDRRVHRYRAKWDNLIPTQHVMQFAGNMGAVSIGIGWEYGKRQQWETHLLLGYVPKYDSRHGKITVTLKENYIPWSIYMNNGWSLEPFECGLYFNSVIGSEFWTKQPTKYGSGYYPFSTRFRPNIFIGQRITKDIPHSRRKYIKSVTAFYELSTCDICFMPVIRNGNVRFWDLFGISVGIKTQVF